MKKLVIPKWVGAIPQGAHGSGSIQKKYWRVISDKVRIRDFIKHKICISCPRAFMHWNESQACHFKSWAVCRGYSKWDELNIFGGCAYCNTGFNGNEVGAKFRDGIISRHGQERMDYIERLSAYPTEKMYDGEIIEKIKQVIISMDDLPIKPDYYAKVRNHPSFA